MIFRGIGRDRFNELRIGHTKCRGLGGLSLDVGVSVSIRVLSQVERVVRDKPAGA